MAKESFFSRLFGWNDQDEEAITTAEQEETITEEGSVGTTLQDAVVFVEELQSYYYNDICKMQADLIIQATLSEQQTRIAQKKIRQDQTALTQIDQILAELKEWSGEFQAVWKKAIYSFYDEIERQKLVSVQTKVFTVLLQLYAVNTRAELATVIAKRLEVYRKAWNIEKTTELPKNYNVILTDGKDGIETYHFGNFCKRVCVSANEAELTVNQLEQIRNMQIDVREQIPTDTVWVHVTNATRLQLNFMRRTCLVNATWEYQEEDAAPLLLDVVNTCDFEQYIKGVLQLVFMKNRYAIVTLVIPTQEMLKIIGPTERNGEKVEICKWLRFILKERSNLYKENLRTQRLDRRNIPEKLEFMSFAEFRKVYF